MTTIYTVNNKVLKNSANDKWLIKKEVPVDPLNPLGLPPNTVRVRTSDGNVPYKPSSATYETATLVSGTSDVYDVYKSGTNFTYLLYGARNVVEILGANTTNIVSMQSMFYNSGSLTSVTLFDTSNVTSMYGMFYNCTSLTSIPLYDTSKVTDTRDMFRNCTNVQSGALALYNQASTQANPPSNHSGTFYKCGLNTDTGAAELEQIPSSWK